MGVVEIPGRANEAGEPSKFRPKVKDSLQLSSYKLRPLSTIGLLFSSPYFSVPFRADLRYLPPCTSSSGLTASSMAAQRKQVAAIRSNVFSPTYFFGRFVFLTSRISGPFRSLATMRDTEGTKFPKARNSKHRGRNPPAHIDILSDTNVSQFCRVSIFVPPFWDSKKPRSNGRVFEIYRRSCNNTERFERRR